MEIKAIIKSNALPGRKRTSDTKPDIFMLLIDEDPRNCTDGCDAPIGSLASVPTPEGYIPYYKWGVGSNDWSPVVNRTRAVEFVAQGTGPSKTTTVIDGPVIAEEMGIDDQIFLRWAIPDNIIINEVLFLNVHFYLNSSELGKLISFTLDVGGSDGLPINTLLGVESSIDIPVSDQYIDKHVIFTLTNESYPKAGFDSINMKLKRIASSDDPVAHPRIHLITVQF
jgi:hypothetical protein